MESSDKMEPMAYALLCITVVLWASAFVGIRASLPSYTPGALALFRYAVAGACMLPVFFLLPNRRRLQLRNLWPLMLAGIIGFSIYNVTLNIGEVTVPAGIASFIVSLIPVFIALLAIIFLGERLSKWAGIGIMISFIGICIIAIGEHAGIKFDYGVIWTLITAICGGIYSVMQKRLLKRFHPIEMTSYAIWFGLIPLLVFLPSLMREIPKASWHATLSVIYIGIFPGAIAYLAWSFALAKLPAAKAATYLYALPIASTIIAWFWLREQPGWISFLGGLIALFGAIVVHFSRVR